MNEEAERLHRKVQNHLNSHTLQEISRILIDSYRGGKNHVLRRFAEAAFTEDDHRETAPNRLFLKLIKFYHPDRTEALARESNRALERGDTASLSAFLKALSAGADGKELPGSSDQTGTPRRSGSGRSEGYERRDERYTYSFEEEYRYGEEDFGYRTYTPFEDEFGDPEAEAFVGPDIDFDFLSAVSAEYLGNLGMPLGPSDLAALEGELDLSGYGMSELDGIEYCRAVTRLNLTHNRIDNLYSLRYLVYLRELFLAENHIHSLDNLVELFNLEILDVSRNDIEELAPLIELENLKFVDARENPLRFSEEIRELERRGVVVLYDL
jgi:hypothetical protein